jgi:CHAT domain-containing protein
MLALHVLSTEIVAVMLRPGGPPILKRIPCPSPLWSRVLRAFGESMNMRSLAQSRPTTMDHEWMAFGETIFGPFAAELVSVDSLILLPHAALHALPLGALHCGGHPLITRMAVTVLPSLGVLQAISARSRQRSTTEALVLSAVAAEAERDSFDGEAYAVASTLGVTARIDARRSDLLERSRGAQVIHVCCHGHFDDDDPFASHLVFSDGPVQARELIVLTLDADLTVLSACETGVPSLTRGEAYDGFARSLLEAGSRAVLLTLWNVNSQATRRWMEHFYRATPTLGFAGAHRAATLALRDEYPDPVYWAPFILSDLNISAKNVLS